MTTQKTTGNFVTLSPEGERMAAFATREDQELFEAARRLVEHCRKSGHGLPEAIQKIEALAQGAIPRVAVYVDERTVQYTKSDQPIELLVIDYQVPSESDPWAEEVGEEPETIGGRRAYVRQEEIILEPGERMANLYAEHQRNWEESARKDAEYAMNTERVPGR